MVSISALKELKITELTKDNIGSVIEILKDTPEEMFDITPKEALLDIYQQVKVLLNDE